MGVFAEWQGRYAVVGIATVPVDPDKKVPLVSHWQKFGLPGSTALTRKFEDCNGIAFRCGAHNGITILDIDLPDEQLLRQALERHGDTPLIERTASGKYHGWYRHNGEPRSIKRLWGKDVPIDLLGDGLSIAAPTLRSDGTAYHFFRGSLDDVPNLPIMGGLEENKKTQTKPETLRASADPEILRTSADDVVRLGSRNDTLFRACLRQAPKEPNIHQLMEYAM